MRKKGRKKTSRASPSFLRLQKQKLPQEWFSQAWKKFMSNSKWEKKEIFVVRKTQKLENQLKYFHIFVSSSLRDVLSTRERWNIRKKREKSLSFSFPMILDVEFDEVRVTRRGNKRKKKPEKRVRRRKFYVIKSCLVIFMCCSLDELSDFIYILFGTRSNSKRLETFER